MTSTTILLFCFILSSHLSVNVLAAEPQVLLKSQIENAKSFAKCLNAGNSEERTLCFQICKLVEENPETDICKFPKFCTGGCKIACEEHNGNIPVPKFESFSASKCEVSWSMDSETKQNVVFVVAGLDLGGMWHLVFDDLLMNRLTLSSHSMTKYNMLEVIAVGEGGEVDKVDISLLEGYGEECGRSGKQFTEISENLSPMLTASLVVLLSAIILLCISLYLYRVKRSYSGLPTIQQV
jgi:hypothetical protein